MIKLFAVQTLLTVQLLDICEPHQLQEFARIIFVDDIMNVQRSFEHHEPLIETPPFEGLDDSKRVSNDHFLFDCDYFSIWFQIQVLNVASDLE